MTPTKVLGQPYPTLNLGLPTTNQAPNLFGLNNAQKPLFGGQRLFGPAPTASDFD